MDRFIHQGKLAFLAAIAANWRRFLSQSGPNSLKIGVCPIKAVKKQDRKKMPNEPR